jgi:hypothetical protein
MCNDICKYKVTISYVWDKPYLASYYDDGIDDLDDTDKIGGTGYYRSHLIVYQRRLRRWL